MTTTAEWRKWNALNTKPITNADRIRSMTDEELAHFFYNLDSTIIAKDLPPYIAPSKEEWLDWLKQEVESNDS